MGEVYICRHGETEWSGNGRHTSFTDIPLTENGRREAKELRARLAGKEFARVFVSPLRRARLTCEIAGYGDECAVIEDLTEWNYGEYEGLTTPEIRESVPDWTVFKYGSPGGESLEEVGARADRIIELVQDIDDDVALFSSGHFSRVLGARWIGLPASGGQHLLLSTASLSILGYDREHRALKLWNDISHRQ